MSVHDNCEIRFPLLCQKVFYVTGNVLSHRVNAISEAHHCYVMIMLIILTLDVITSNQQGRFHQNFNISKKI